MQYKKKSEGHEVTFAQRTQPVSSVTNGKVIVSELLFAELRALLAPNSEQQVS